MKARLVPLCFGLPDDPDLVAQTERLRELLVDVAEILELRPLGSAVPADADAVLFPQLVGDVYRRVPELRELTQPLLVLTSEFGTMAMWDWEIISYLRGEGIATLAPYSLADARTACRALAAKRRLRGGSFLVFQDAPGEGGFQPEIFKRFYWWEEECAERMRDRFGHAIVRRSYAELAARAKAVADEAVREDWQRVRDDVPLGEVAERQVLSALKLYRVLREEVEANGAVLAAGANCLNESAFSDTTPCLAWNLLYQEHGLIWGCEGDVVSMLTKFVLHESLGLPVMMTNLYPFLMGEAALKHERIPEFPPVDGPPEDYVLAAHCGYLGVVPRPFATEWRLQSKVLAIVDENATAIDARLPLGDLTLAKLDPTFRTLVVAEGALTGYAGYPGSDCRNGALIRVPDGHLLMKRLPSHHSLLVAGHDRAGVELIGDVFGLSVERL